MMGRHTVGRERGSPRWDKCESVRNSTGWGRGQKGEGRGRAKSQRKITADRHQTRKVLLKATGHVLVGLTPRSCTGRYIGMNAQSSTVRIHEFIVIVWQCGPLMIAIFRIDPRRSYIYLIPTASIAIQRRSSGCG